MIVDSGGHSKVHLLISDLRPAQQLLQIEPDEILQFVFSLYAKSDLKAEYELYDSNKFGNNFAAITTSASNIHLQLTELRADKIHRTEFMSSSLLASNSSIFCVQFST